MRWRPAAYVRSANVRVDAGAYDVLIAGQALARGWTVVTAKVRDLWEVEGLKIQDWSDPGEVKTVTGGLQYRPPPR